MYYNYTDEQKYFLSVTDAMLKDDFSVEEIVEFWNCEDQDQVDGILGSLMLTESVDYSNPDLEVVCEAFGMGWLSRNAGRLWKRLRGINPKTGNPKITGGTSKVKQATDKVKQGTGAVVDKTKKALDKLPPGAKGGLAVAGAGLTLIGGKDVLDYGKDAVDYIKDKGNEPTTQPSTTQPPKDPPKKDDKTTTTITPYKSQSGTSLLAPSKGPKWWQTYEKAARPYNSSKRYYDNIRK